MMACVPEAKRRVRGQPLFLEHTAEQGFPPGSRTYVSNHRGAVGAAEHDVKGLVDHDVKELHRILLIRGKVQVHDRSPVDADPGVVADDRVNDHVVQALPGEYARQLGTGQILPCRQALFNDGNERLYPGQVVPDPGQAVERRLFTAETHFQVLRGKSDRSQLPGVGKDSAIGGMVKKLVGAYLSVEVQEEGSDAALINPHILTPRLDEFSPQPAIPLVSVQLA